MLRRSVAFLFSNLVREIDPNGFQGDYRRLGHVNRAETKKAALAAVRSRTNVIFCGHYGTGKLTVLKSIGLLCEKELKLKVAYVSADAARANRLDGYLINHFIGLRMSRDELPSQEQLEGTLERHVRLADTVYAGSVPSLCNIDVLILDSVEKIDPVLLRSMDAVASRLRGGPAAAAAETSGAPAAAKRTSAPFGGLRVFAAADFWQLPHVHPSSDTGGYVYQSDDWGTWFPKQTLLTKTHGQSKDLQRFTFKALFGELSDEEVAEMEKRSLSGKPEEASALLSPLSAGSDGGGRGSRHMNEDEAQGEEEDDDDEGGEEEDEEEEDSTSARAALAAAASPGASLNDKMISNADALTRFSPRFLKQPTVKVMPPRFRLLKQTEIGNFLVNMLVQSSTPQSFGLVDALSVGVGSRVHLLLDGPKGYGIPAGAVGEVVAVREHFVTVHFTEQNRTVDVPRMRITCYHPDFPEVRYELRQFPLFPRNRLCPASMRLHPNAFQVSINGRRMADTNDFGNLLARMRSFKDFTLRNIATFVHLDGMVHEPTRIYYHQITGRPLTTASGYWCRNCKSFIPTAEFFAHWEQCVKSVRWCGECNKTVTLVMLEPHREKHQVVLCMDCGQAVEWRHWEAHRLSCAMMMREVSPDNEFLPLRTRQLALELGLDKRDLHTMRGFSRSMLPKPKIG